MILNRFINNKKNILLFIFILSFFLRSIYTLVPQANYFKDILPINFNAKTQISDDRTYTILANGVIENGYPSENSKFSSYAGFLYPYIVALNLLFSENYIYLFFFQIALDSLVSILLTLIVLSITQNYKISFLSGLLYATYYPNFIFPARVLTETVFTFLLISAIYFIMSGFKKMNYKYFIYFIIFISLASLTRPMMYYVFFILFIYLLYLAFIKKEITKKIIFIVFIFFAFQIPSSYFSYKSSGRLSAEGGTGGWFSVLTGTYLPLEGDALTVDDEVTYPEHPVARIYKLSDENNWNEFQRDSAFKAEAILQLKNNFINHPFESVKVMVIQISRFWFNMPYYIRFHPRYGTILQAIYKFFITILMLYGCYLTLFKYKSKFLNFVLLFLISYMLLHSIVFSILRYSAPLVPIMILFSSIGILQLKNKYYKSNPNKIPK